MLDSQLFNSPFFVPTQYQVNGKSYIEDHDFTYGRECSYEACSEIFPARLRHLSEVDSQGKRTGNSSEGLFLVQCRCCSAHAIMPEKSINPSVNWSKVLPKELQVTLPKSCLSHLGNAVIPKVVLGELPKEVKPALNYQRFSNLWEKCVQHEKSCPFADYKIEEKAIPESSDLSNAMHMMNIGMTAGPKRFEDAEYTPSSTSRRLSDIEYARIKQLIPDLRNAQKKAA